MEHDHNSSPKRMKIALKDDDTVKCLELIDNNDHEGLSKRINADVVNLSIYPDGTESSKTRILFYAIKKDKVDCVRLLLKCGADVNLGDDCDESANKEWISESPLHYCIERKSSGEIMCVLMNQSGCKTNESHIRTTILAGNSAALQLILEYDHNSIPADIKEILKLYAMPDVPIIDTLAVLEKFIDFKSLNRDTRHQNINGVPTLTYFALTRTNLTINEATAIIKFCVKLKCSVNAKYISDVPLHAAVESNNENFVKALVKSKANVNRINSNGKCALYEALVKNNNDLFKFLLLNGADSLQKSTDWRHESVLQCAIRNKHFSRVCEIIEIGKKINISGEEFKIPILHTILEELISQRLEDKIEMDPLLDIVHTCIGRGLDLNTRCDIRQILNKISFRGHSVFHIAIRFFNADFCEELISLGSDINAVTDYNQCSYSLAIDYSYKDQDVKGSYDECVAKLLLLQKYGINMEEKLPLPFRKMMGYNEIRFANPCLYMDNPTPPLRILLSSHNIELAECIFPLMVPSRTLFVKDMCLALQTGNFPLSYQILQSVQKEFRFDSVSIGDLKPLFEQPLDSDGPLLSFSRDSPEFMLIASLVQKGFDINSIDKNGNSIFHYACNSIRFSGEDSVTNFVLLLLESGGRPSLDCVNNMHQSPLHFALSVNQKLSENSKGKHFVKALLKYGADIRRKTLLGYSAIHIAINSGSHSSIKMLVEKSMPENDIVNSWRRLRQLKTSPQDGFIEEVLWPKETPDKFYIVTPLTIAIMKKNKELIEELITEHGAQLGKKDIHNSFVINNMTDFSIANFLFQFLSKDISLKLDKIDNRDPTLEYIFYKLDKDYRRTVDSTEELMNFTINYISRNYNINVKHDNYPPVLLSIIKMAILGQGDPNSNMQLFNYLMDYSNCNFVTGNVVNSIPLLTYLFRDRDCRNYRKCYFELRSSCPAFESQKARKILYQRNYIMRMLLQRCPYDLWRSCHFDSYVYHKEDFEIIRCILMTGARTNLINQWPNIQVCQHMESEVNMVDNFVSKEELTMKIDLARHCPPSLTELSLMALRNFSDVRSGLMNLEFPKQLKELIEFLDVESDGELSWNLLTLS